MKAHGHGHAHSHGHGHSHAHGGDLNLKAAYLHVIADAVTSVLALVALTAGKFLGWYWMDSVMGVVGSIVVGQWAWSLLRDAGSILLDRTPETDLCDEIRKAVESDGDARIADLHVWQIGTGQFSAIVSIVARSPKSPDHYHGLFREHEELLHVTVEIRKADESR
jgi:cation diffusion facilitator family transporter